MELKKRIYVNNEQVELALAIALDAHKGQVDLDGKPSILHPLAVGMEGENLTEMCVGFLHDVVEDSDYTFERLREMGPQDHSHLAGAHPRQVGALYGLYPQHRSLGQRSRPTGKDQRPAPQPPARHHRRPHQAGKETHRGTGLSATKRRVHTACGLNILHRENFCDTCK